MAYWLMKSEPNTYSIEDLAKAPGQKGFWDGVRNYQVRGFIRDQMQPGDLAYFYHSSCPVPGIVGIVRITGPAVPDPTAFDPVSQYYDPRSVADAPRWWGVPVQLVEQFTRIITLPLLRQQQKLASMLILKKGNRLSITPVTEQEWLLINQLK